MSDEFMPVAAIPSRARSDEPQKPLPPIAEAPPLAKPARRRRTRKAALPKPEITRIKRTRARNKAKIKEVKARAKNPNRPLELKNQMTALIDAITHLGSPAELKTFGALTAALRPVSKTGRKRLIKALVRVYG